MRISISIFSIIIFCGCIRQESKEKKVSKNVDTLKNITTSLTSECIQKDTITNMMTKIHYIYRNGKYQISWGNNSYNRVYDSLYSCDFDKSTGLWDFVPKLISETKNNLIFKNVLWTSSGGNPDPIEYYVIICPKNVKDNIYEKIFFIQCEGSYIVYGDSHNEYVHLENIETKRIQTVTLKPKPYLSRSPTLSINKTQIKKKTFYIEYEALDKNEKTITVKDTIKIEI